MKNRVTGLAFVFSIAGAISIGCGSDDAATTPNKGGAGGLAGSGGKAGSANNAGSAGKSGSAGEGDAGNPSGVAGEGGQPGGDQGGAGGEAAGSGPGGEGGGAGEGPDAHTRQLQRGEVIVRSISLCGGCHTASGGSELSGNPAFAGNLGAPNLTDDPSGIGGFSDEQVVNALRNGIALRKRDDGQDRHLSSVMPYWLFHNLSDDDALSIVAFLRSLPPVATALGDRPDATPIGPLAPSSLPDSELLPTEPNYATAQYGKYLVSGVAQCVKCHSPSSGGLPSADFFAGIPPTTTTQIFASNITPDDATGIGGWSAADVVTALKVGTNKAGLTLCGAMPSAGKGYGGMSDTDAFAIGVYLTTIPGVNKPETAPSIEPACP